MTLNHLWKTFRRFVYETGIRWGWEIRRWPHPATYAGALKQILNSRNINCIIDVGANRGQFALLTRKLGYRGRIVSIEPGSEAFKVLESLAAADKDWLVLRMALGAEPGKAKLHITSWDELSSLLLPTVHIHRYSPHLSQVVRVEEVSVSTLTLLFDELIEGISEPRVFLKIDTQGYDFEVLKGAETVLSRIDALQVEVAFVPLYNGQPSGYEVISWCESHGFRLHGLFPIVHDPSGYLVEADAIFVRIKENGG